MGAISRMAAKAKANAAAKAKANAAAKATARTETAIQSNAYGGGL